MAITNGAYLARHSTRGEQYVIDIEEYNGTFVAVEHRHDLYDRTVEAIAERGYTLIPLLIATPERITAIESLIRYAHLERIGAGLLGKPGGENVNVLEAMLQEMRGSHDE